MDPLSWLIIGCTIGCLIAFGLYRIAYELQQLRIVLGSQARVVALVESMKDDDGPHSE